MFWFLLILFLFSISICTSWFWISNYVFLCHVVFVLWNWLANIYQTWIYEYSFSSLWVLPFSNRHCPSLLHGNPCGLRSNLQDTSIVILTWLQLQLFGVSSAIVSPSAFVWTCRWTLLLAENTWMVLVFLLSMSIGVF